MKYKKAVFRFFCCFLTTGLILLAGSSNPVFAQRLASQEVRWLRVSSLRSTFAIEGSEFEMHRTGMEAEQSDGLRWPAQFRYQDNVAAKSMWIGTANYYEAALGSTIPYKVVGVGPKWANPLTEIMPVRFELVGQSQAPQVIVDGEPASDNILNDALDVIDNNLISDRMIINVLHTSIGITITRKIMAFTQQNHDNYYIYDYVFKNTGIRDLQGTLAPVTLTDCIFHFQYRYAVGNEAFKYNWAPSGNVSWGRNCVNEVVGQDPTDPDFEYRAHYSWYGPHSTSPVSDWGAPDYKTTGNLGGCQYVGVVTLHADKSAQDNLDDPYQPKTTMYIASDTGPQKLNQFDPQYMTKKYEVMSAGHPDKTHAQEVGDSFADKWASDAGGFAQGQGFGPYTLAPGDSIHIVLAECVSGLKREKSLEVGKSWFQNKSPFILPDGSTITDRDEYKEKWVKTGIDSLKQTFRNALKNYDAQYKIPQPPPPPSQFTVKSGGDRITLSWTNEAESYLNFDGYEIYRAIDIPDTLYDKIFNCDASNVVNTFNDTTALRGRDYYYYIVSKDDGSTNDINPGMPLVSSKFYTMTNKPAYLRRPAEDSLSKIRVVPNPYHIKSSSLQFGRETPDRIAFFGLPPVCTIKIYTERGDLIQTIEHTDGSGDELWDSLTNSRQIIVSGLYIVYFETPEGESTFRKFIVIR